MTWKDELVNVLVGGVCFTLIALLIWWQPMLMFYAWCAFMAVAVSWITGVLVRECWWT